MTTLRGDCVEGVVERRHGAVPRRLDHRATVSCDTPRDDCIVELDGLPHLGRLLFPASGARLDIGEHECSGSVGLGHRLATPMRGPGRSSGEATIWRS
jgi:hypothetical protein